MTDKPTRGRPRSFDIKEALRGAMLLFWQRGFDAATLPELLEAMGGISPPSFYAAFGSKEKVFADAVALYREEIAGPSLAAIQGGATAREAVAAMLQASLESFLGRGMPTGCLFVLGGVNAGNVAVGELMAEVRHAGLELLRKRVRQGIADGDVPATADVSAIAAFYTMATYGLALGARDGLPRASLQRAADAAIAAWDGLTGAGTGRPRGGRRGQAGSLRAAGGAARPK